MSELEKRVRLEVTLPPAIRGKVVKYSHRAGLTQSQLVEHFVRRGLREMSDQVSEIVYELRERMDFMPPESGEILAYEKWGTEALRAVDPD